MGVLAGPVFCCTSTFTYYERAFGKLRPLHDLASGYVIQPVDLGHLKSFKKILNSGKIIPGQNIIHPETVL